MKKILITIFTLVAMIGYSQSNMNVQIKNEEGFIKIKWLYPTLYYSGGMDIYRSSDQGLSWTKITKTPLFMDTETRTGDSKKMKVFLGLIKQIEGDKKDIGFAKLAILSEMVTNKEYAKRLNIYYEDADVISGTTYRYKVEQAENANILGISKDITAGGLNPPFAINNPEFLYANDEGAKFKWEHDSKAYYGVNAYRSNDRDGKVVKINKKPILVFKFYDKGGILRFPDVMMIDSTLKRGLEYTYTFRPVDMFNDEGEVTDDISVILEDTKPPQPAKDLKVTVDKLNVKLIWGASKSDDVEGYRIIRQDVNLNETVIEELVKGISYEYEAEKSGQFFFLVEAVDYAGNTSSTIIADGKIPDVFPTSNITGFKSIFDDKTGKITLTWNPVPEQDDLDSYRVLRYASSDETNPKDIQAYSNISNNIDKNTSFTDQVVLESQTKYKYAIYTTDTVSNYSEAQYTDWITIPDIVAPTSPVLIDASGDFDKITLNWLPSNDFDVVSYEIYRKKQGDQTKAKLLAQVSSESRSYEDAKVENDVMYVYSLKAKDASNNYSEPSNEYPIKTRRNRSPEATINVKLKAKYKKKDKKTVLKWSSKDVEDIKGYVVFKQSKGGRFIPLSGITTEQSTIDIKAVKGETYNYQLRVYTNNGQTLKSEIISITI